MHHLHSQIIPEPRHKQAVNIPKAFSELLETFLLAVILFIIINTATARILVQSISMLPNLKEGNLVLVNRLAYRFGMPQRGDIIVFDNPVNPMDVPYIKRIIGLPGDRILIENSQVFVNDQLLSEPYLQTSTLRGGEWQVPAHSYFVLGDNRNNSSDSRVWGMVPGANIIGRAEAVYWPPQDWDILHFPFAIAAQP